MSAPAWTQPQRRAIETVDRSVLVSAAAGSGKTAVLAERCAYLVCGAPPSQRCRVDELLVVTFTEAAAAEMRSRIHAALRARLEQSPQDGYLRAQLASLDSAQISTIHAFCLWVLRRWFSQAGVDPAAVILDEDEARLLKAETVEALFRALYESDSAMAGRFRDLVDDYALGQDQKVAEHILALHGFLVSLPPTDDWAGRARRRIVEREPIIDEARRDLATELRRQLSHCRALCDTIASSLPEGAFYGERIAEYAEQLEAWHVQASGRPDVAGADESYELVRSSMAAFSLSSKGAPRFGKTAPEAAIARRDAARDMYEFVAKKLFAGRLERYFSRFTVEQMRAGLARIAPYAGGLLDLVSAFQRRYQSAKRALAVLDFSDLERYAFELLHDAPTNSSVAAELRNRFAHVLVDEFQDVNPLQQAILRAASREPDADRANNLFAVGDVKQSVYRFRQAEPTIFLQRMTEFADGAAGGAAIALQENFRSQHTILTGVNLIFGALMRHGTSLIEYDAAAELRCGDPVRQKLVDRPIELHLLERKVNAGPSDEADVESADDEESDDGPRSPWDDATTWDSVEREGYLIGSEVRKLVGRARRADGGPIRFRDIAILLRSAACRAGPMAAVLTRMGVPAYTSAGETLFDTIEIQDVLSLLRVLDNAQQDIPLAAVLSSGITGTALSPDDLVALRCFDREAPFHAAVRQFARTGPDGELKDRLKGILRWLDRYRDRIRRRPLAEVLWALYTETGYLAYATGLEGGLQRRANLLYLHDRARQFGTFAKQGLHRFLRFIESLRAEDRAISAAPAVGEGEDVVRILTIHQSKGLEFPIVFVADLGKSFNLEDTRGRIIFDRDAGLGLRVVDRERMIEYPSVAHQRAAMQIAAAARDEELRVLYVALTRARERLVLVGSGHLDALLRNFAPGAAWGGRALRSAVTDLDVLTAGSPLEWILPALGAAPGGAVRWSPHARDGGETRPIFDVHTHRTAEMMEWKLRPIESDGLKATRRAVARLDALPAHEPLAADAAPIGDVLARLEFEYPYLPAASMRAVVSASEVKRSGDDHFRFPISDFRMARDTTTRRKSGRGEQEPIGIRQSAADQSSRTAAQLAGTATHRFLQHVDLARVGDAAAVREQIRTMIGDRRLNEAEVGGIDIDALAWFFATPLGRAVRDGGDAYVREFMFISAEPPDLFDATLAGSVADPVLVRGVIDGLLVSPAGIQIIDFKTDRVGENELADRAATYAPQLQLYAHAAAKHWRRPVDACHLVFLHPRRIVELADQKHRASTRGN